MAQKNAVTSVNPRNAAELILHAVVDSHKTTNVWQIWTYSIYKTIAEIQQKKTHQYPFQLMSLKYIETSLCSSSKFKESRTNTPQWLRPHILFIHIMYKRMLEMCKRTWKTSATMEPHWPFMLSPPARSRRLCSLSKQRDLSRREDPSIAPGRVSKSLQTHLTLFKLEPLARKAIPRCALLAALGPRGFVQKQICPKINFSIIMRHCAMFTSGARRGVCKLLTLWYFFWATRLHIQFYPRVRLAPVILFWRFESVIYKDNLTKVNPRRTLKLRNEFCEVICRLFSCTQCCFYLFQVFWWLPFIKETSMLLSRQPSRGTSSSSQELK